MRILIKELRFSERVLLPLRLFLGITFLYAGIQKLTDPQFFNPSATGFIGKQIMAFAHGSPIHNVLLHVALPHAVFFGALIALGEIAIGIGTLLGFLFRPAAFFGMLLSLMFFLSASWHVYPYFYGADIVFVFAWIPLLLAGPIGNGLPSIDALLVPRILMDTPPEWRRMIRTSCKLSTLTVSIAAGWRPRYEACPCPLRPASADCGRSDVQDVVRFAGGRALRAA